MKKNETTEIENCLENKGKGDFNINEYEEPNNTETLEILKKEFLFLNNELRNIRKFK